jgi:hypothetical protein
VQGWSGAAAGLKAASRPCLLVAFHILASNQKSLLRTQAAFIVIFGMICKACRVAKNSRALPDALNLFHRDLFCDLQPVN